MAEGTIARSSAEIGIVVKDVEAATPFYQEGLGLRHLVDLGAIGPFTQQRRFAHGDTVVVKLIQLVDPPQSANPPGGLDAPVTGLRYATLAVDDLEGVVARCEQLGANVPHPIIEWKPGSKVAVVEDFDGNWFELVPRS